MKYFLPIIIFFLIISPTIVSSQGGSLGGNESDPGSLGGNASNPGSLGGNPGGGVQSIFLQNPLKQDHIVCLMQDILGVIMVFAVPLIVFMFIYAGFLFVMDRGSEKNLSQAKNALLYAVIGAVIILGAEALLFVIQGTVETFGTIPAGNNLCPR